MNLAKRWMNLLLVVFFGLSACTPPPPAAPSEVPTPTTTTQAAPAESPAEDILYVNLVWHQHQPLYYKNADGIYTRPWVRVHATKDYYDMAALVKDYPNVHLTINLTPVLLRQLEDFSKNGTKDLYWAYAEIPVEALTIEQKTFLLTRFFDANRDNIVARFPRYLALLEKRGGADSESIAKALQSFTDQDFRDLQVWFNLAWFDPMFLEEEPLKTLVTKGEGFSEEDKQIVFDEARKIIQEILPLHKEMQDSGQIQVITTPYAHPILPLIYNSDLAAVGNPQADLPARFSWPNDAITHLQKSVDIYQVNFGQPPEGLWPGEGSVAQEIIPLVSKAGYAWMATGEPVLAQSLGIGSFTRNSQETVQQADDLYRPYYVTQGDHRVAVVFRDGTLSDKIGFEYSQRDAETAASDLMQRLENIRLRLKEEGAQGPHLVSIILDGENAWEYYPNDGKAFLNAMYRNFSESQTVKTITPTEYLALFPEQRELGQLFPGAWFSPNYDTWIGEAEERTAWEYLGKVREHLAKYDLTQKRTTTPEKLALAQDFMYLAEGSDWFWWYGSDQDSGQDEYFDLGFRALLKGVYESLGDEPPAFLDVPVIPLRPAAPEQPMGEPMTVVADGLIGEAEWSNAAVYTDSQSNLLKIGLDAQNLQLALQVSDLAILSGGAGIYLSTPKATVRYPFAYSPDNAAADDFVGLSASHLFFWKDAKLSAFLASEDGWVENGTVGGGYLGADGLEIQIPLSTLGESLEAGDDVRLVVVAGEGAAAFPAEGPAQIILPELGATQEIMAVEDPAGDDHGPGTYTYPTDAVFVPGTFDIETFNVGYDDNSVVFTFRMAAPITNPWGSTANLSLQTFDVYVDIDPGVGSGSRLLLGGRNAALQAGDGWDVAIWAEGWYPEIFTADASSGEIKSFNLDYKMIVSPDKNTVSLRVPREVFGDGDPAEWGYAAMVLSQDGFPSTGVLRVRDVAAENSQWKWGGAPEATNATRIIDLVWPADGAQTQEEMLSGFAASSLPIGDLAADDLAQIELLRVKKD